MNKPYFSGTKSVLKFPFKNNSLYSIKIKGLKSTSNKICLWTTKRRGLVQIPMSELCLNTDLNVNYINTYIVGPKVTSITICDVRSNFFSYEGISITCCSRHDLLRESKTCKILDVAPVEVYKNKFNRRLNVACILDVFSYRCFGYELNLFPVDLNNWKSVIDNNSIDMFLCESAWDGNDGAWRGMFINWDTGDTIKQRPLLDLLNYLDECKIPKVFYNKEDPVNFDNFIGLAKRFFDNLSCVVTTDEDVVAKYKGMGCTNITAFPFCCQPVLHNPANRKTDSNMTILFPCTYYAVKYPERCQEMRSMIDKHITNIDIYDRQFLYNKMILQIGDNTTVNYYRFPAKYTSRIKGMLDYEQVLQLYKSYRCVMNVNTVTDSPTMFSRRVMEAAASGTTLISNKSDGMKRILGDDVFVWDVPKDADNITRMLKDDDYRDKVADTLYKKVMREYTYATLIDKILQCVPVLKKKVGDESKIINKKIVCLIILSSNKQLVKMKGFTEKYPCILVSNNKLGDSLGDKVIKLDKLRKDMFIKYDLCAMMSADCTYDNNFIEDSLLASLYTDADVIGKGCYYDKDNNKIGVGLEHRFTNKLNLNSVLINLKADSVLDMFGPKILSSLGEYLDKQFTGNNFYSVDRYGFIV